MSKKMTLSTFEKACFGALRGLIRNGEPWFVAKDVCDCLGLNNVSQALVALDEDEKITVTNPEGNPRAGIPLTFNLINEPGLYTLILRSHKPEAKEFKRWVTHEVLPAIRKTGTYSEVDDNARKWKLRRLDGKKTRRQQTDMMKAAGVSSSRDYAASTAILHQSWSGMTPSKHKVYKHLDRKDALRDHCTYTELSMIDLSEQMHCVKMRKAGASSSQDAIACAKDCVSPMQRIAQIYEEATGERIASPLNNLPGSEKKAIDAIHDEAALGSVVKVLTA